VVAGSIPAGPTKNKAFDIQRLYFYALGRESPYCFCMLDKSIKNIIFDLGGVILDLSVDSTLQAFAKLSGLPKHDVQDLFISSAGFEQYEKGALSDAEFRDFVRKTYSLNASDAQLDSCWNAMLLGLPVEKLHLLTRLMKSNTVVLLSNTNNIHLSFINKNIMPGVANATSLDSFFHKSYYSHIIGMRKPDAEIFEYVLKENNFRAEETLFLDDNKYNVAGASSVGIQTVHVTNPDLILEYFL
jgi:glucose-1-phosphatase